MPTPGKGSIRVAGSEFSAAAVTTMPTHTDPVAPPMNHGPRQSCDRPFISAAGFLVTVMVQIISRICTNLVGLLDDDPASRHRYPGRGSTNLLPDRYGV